MILIQIMSSHQIIAPLMMLIVVPRRPTSGKRARGAHAHCSLQEQDEEEEAENTGELQLLHPAQVSRQASVLPGLGL